MISAKTVVLIGIVALLVSATGFLLEMTGITQGRYALYIAVPIGAITAIVGGIAAMLGLIKNDLK